MEMLNEMAVFAQVVDSGGFSAAARHLGVATSAVSRHVARLEAHLGGRLLQRTTRSLSLTELGEQVHAACVRMLTTAREVHVLAGSYRARPNGVLRVSAPIVFGQVWLAPRLPGFLDLHPDVDVRLTLTDRTIDLVEDGIDLAIRIARELAPGLAARPLCQMQYVLVASQTYLAAHGAPDAPEDLLRHRCCYLGYGQFDGHWFMRSSERSASVDIPARITINNSGAIMALVEADGGIGLVPDFAAQAALACGRVKQLLPAWTFDTPYAGAVHAVYTPGRHLALKVRALIDYLTTT
ncbi:MULTISPECIES: LysR family transcriptional regulator [unclassified Janthinobacterium]|uniref:LysR family transcriptional regulator n=1 Tax=unclassified Janthinobacterium TaxID=2610881 RepID=UPI00178E62B0|nr:MULTISPECIES: LysR family transcriptional regulator [unclassified Janthinobacterium]MBB5367648.1 DNA-binding transcriptional LysR family regulator [Janthinobacterium sp. K2C7]MBB5379874.1 DNA-binding transcriptional LysR family regulator [Janthinobacterium sp. K2Li3]MBB5386030.1 DNA-binding transcriptional LysR family regulator [Janthinobacterium sp. K2E3]